MSRDAEGTPRGLPPTIGRYQILACLSSDPLGDVYHGFDPLLERPVIVKFFNLATVDPATHGAIKLKFYDEMRRVGMLGHHGIAALFDGGELPGGLFFANEFVDGQSLADLLAGGVDLELPRRTSLLVQMGDALDYAHQMGVLHLTLDPSHVRVDSYQRLKIGGFGVAAVLDVVAAAAGTPIPLSPKDSAPERLRGEAGDQRADVFSFARLALEVLRNPAEVPSLSSSLNDDTGEGRVPLLPAYLAAQGVPADRWSEVFTRALSTDPARRFETSVAFVLDLLQMLGAGDETRLIWEPPMPVEDLTPAGALPAPAVNMEDFPETMMGSAMDLSRPPAPPESHHDSDETMLAASPDSPTITALDHRAAKREPPKRPTKA